MPSIAPNEGGAGAHLLGPVGTTWCHMSRRLHMSHRLHIDHSHQRYHSHCSCHVGLAGFEEMVEVEKTGLVEVGVKTQRGVMEVKVLKGVVEVKIRKG